MERPWYLTIKERDAEHWASQILANDEASTDEELRVLFIRNDIRPIVADWWIFQRPQLRGDAAYLD
jgi:hypothetical protein